MILAGGEDGGHRAIAILFRSAICHALVWRSAECAYINLLALVVGRCSIETKQSGAGRLTIDSYRENAIRRRAMAISVKAYGCQTRTLP